MSMKNVIIVVVSVVIGLVIGILIGQGEAPVPTAGDGGEAAMEQKEEHTFKMASVFPGTLEVLGTGGKAFEEAVLEVTNGRVRFQFFDPNKLVPPLEVFESVSQGSVDAGWSSAGFWIGKMPAAALFTSIPFGPDTTEYLAWMFHGDGLKLYRELYGQHNVYVMPCMIIPPEASGWFREPITRPGQLNGLKMRFFGLGGKAMQELGVSVQLLAPGDIFPALERGVLDATEFSMPNTDLNLGFHDIAKHYYFPGWHQQASWNELLVNMDRWNELSEVDQRRVEMACKESIVRSIADGEALQAPAIKEFRSEGVQVHYWSDEMLQTFREASRKVMAQEAADDEFFRKAWNNLKAFRAEFRVWRDLSRLPADMAGLQATDQRMPRQQ